MGQRIRHLEFYGYPDQNVFTSLGSVDLSEIEKINREQDEEISEISGATKDKADLELVNELSAKTDAFIALQGEINEQFAEAISGNTERILALEEYDTEVADKINEIISGITTLDEDVEILSGDVETLKNQMVIVSGNTEAIESLSGTIDDLQDILDGKLDKDEAEETYAKKENVYTKEECDEKFLTEHQSLSAITDDINALSGAIDTIQEEIDNIPSIDTSKFALKTDLNALSGSFSTYSASTDNKIYSMEGEISAITDDISSVNRRINTINGDIEYISNELNNKIGRREFSAFTNDVEDELYQLKTKKADKEELYELSGNVSTLRGDLEQEIANRESADTRLQESIDAVDAKTDSAFTVIREVIGTVDALDDRLDQEILDRINGDITLIGESADTVNADTIWGAKNYATSQKTQAIATANEYTDEKFSSIETEIANKFDEINTELGKKADITYVNEVVDDKVGTLADDVYDRLSAETRDRQATDSELQREIDDLNDIVYSGWSADTQHIYNRLNVITTYDGDSVDNYVNTGNGVLDVLHREFHQLEEEIGIVVNPTLERKNLYETAFGQYNVSNTGNRPEDRTTFSVGIGTSEEDRKNAIEIREDGTVYMWVEGDFLNINDLLSMLAHETYN